MVATGSSWPGAPEPLVVVVTAAEAGARLDRVLAARELGFSRSALQRFMEEGRVLLDGRPATARDKAREGAVVSIAPSPPPPSEATPQALPLTILYEDADLLVVDKAAGMVVHPAPGHPEGTLVNALLHHAQVADAGADPRRPGIVHRLDKDTSGVMVVAKTDLAREGLVAQLSAHTVERAYVAIACGGRLPDRVTYDTLHGRHPGDRKKFTGTVTRGKRAVTHVTLIERLHGGALVRCRLSTGRTHQIRVHLSEAGHPLLGDPVYGRRPRDPRLAAAAAALGRQALHAAVLGFLHPRDGRPMRFETPLPEDLAAAVEALRADRRAP